MKESEFMSYKDGAAYLELHITPGAKSDRLIGVHGKALKISLSAPAEKGKANLHLLRFLSSLLHCRQSQIKIEKGEVNRRKKVRVDGKSCHEIEEALHNANPQLFPRREP